MSFVWSCLENISNNRAYGSWTINDPIITRGCDMKCARGGCFSAVFQRSRLHFQISEGFNNVITMGIVLFSALHVPNPHEANLAVVMCCFVRSVAALQLLTFGLVPRINPWFKAKGSWSVAHDSWQRDLQRLEQLRDQSWESWCECSSWSALGSWCDPQEQHFPLTSLDFGQSCYSRCDSPRKEGLKNH